MPRCEVENSQVTTCGGAGRGLVRSWWLLGLLCFGVGLVRIFALGSHPSVDELATLQMVVLPFLLVASLLVLGFRHWWQVVVVCSFAAGSLWIGYRSWWRSERMGESHVVIVRAPGDPLGVFSRILLDRSRLNGISSRTLRGVAPERLLEEMIAPEPYPPSYVAERFSKPAIALQSDGKTVTVALRELPEPVMPLPDGYPKMRWVPGSRVLRVPGTAARSFQIVHDIVSGEALFARGEGGLASVALLAAVVQVKEGVARQEMPLELLGSLRHRLILMLMNEGLGAAGGTLPPQVSSAQLWCGEQILARVGSSVYRVVPGGRGKGLRKLVVKECSADEAGLLSNRGFLQTMAFVTGHAGESYLWRARKSFVRAIKCGPPGSVAVDTAKDNLSALRVLLPEQGTSQDSKRGRKRQKGKHLRSMRGKGS